MFKLLPGNYRFKVVVNGKSYWSGASNTCTVPGCISDSVTIPATVTVTVRNAAAIPQVGLSVLVYNGTTYAGSTQVSNGAGQATFQLLAGSYRFKVVVNSVTYWSGVYQYLYDSNLHK